MLEQDKFDIDKLLSDLEDAPEPEAKTRGNKMFGDTDHFDAPIPVGQENVECFVLEVFHPEGTCPQRFVYEDHWCPYPRPFPDEQELREFITQELERARKHAEIDNIPVPDSYRGRITKVIVRKEIGPEFEL